MLDCKDVHPRLREFLAGSLEAEFARQVQDHLLTCPICADELERLQAEAYKQSHRYSVPVTRDPLADSRPAAPKAPAEDPKTVIPPDPDPAAEEPETVTVEAEAPQTKKRFPKGRKPWLLLAAVVLIAAVLAAVLLGTDLLQGETEIPSPNGTYTAVLRNGASTENATGFRVHIRDAQTGKDLGNAGWGGCTYRDMVWSDSGNFLAVEYTDQWDISFVFVMPANDPNNWEIGNLDMVLVQYLQSSEGWLGNTSISKIANVYLLQWMPDTDTLLLYVEGYVNTHIDPDFGVDPAGSSQVQLRDGTIPRVGGCVTIDMSTGLVQVLNGFGITVGAETSQQQGQLYRDFEAFLQDGLSHPFNNNAVEAYFGEEALLQLPSLILDNVPFGMYYDQRTGEGIIFSDSFVKIATDLDLLSRMESADGIMLIKLYNSNTTYAYETPSRVYLVVPYGSWALMRSDTN